MPSTTPTSALDQNQPSGQEETKQEAHTVPFPPDVSGRSRDSSENPQGSTLPAFGGNNRPQPGVTESGHEQVFATKHRLIKRDRLYHQSWNRLQLRNQDWSVELWRLVLRILSCGTRPGVHVIFSNQAIVGYRKDVQSPCFQFRLFDVDGRNPVVQAACAMYVITQQSPVPMPLRIIIPAEDIDSSLFLSLPNEVVHAIDNDSPMAPNPVTAAKLGKPKGHLNYGDPNDIFCPVCGEPYDTVNNLIQHGKYQNIVESHDKFPFIGSHQEVDWDEWEKVMTKSRFWSLAQLQEYFETNLSEVICVVEGIDPITGRTFHAVQSYQLQDIHFGEALFADCVYLTGPGKRELAVDLKLFHKIDQLAEQEHEIVFSSGEADDADFPKMKLFSFDDNPRDITSSLFADRDNAKEVSAAIMDIPTNPVQALEAAPSELVLLGDVRPVDRSRRSARRLELSRSKNHSSGELSSSSPPTKVTAVTRVDATTQASLRVDASTQTDPEEQAPFPSIHLSEQLAAHIAEPVALPDAALSVSSTVEAEPAMQPGSATQELPGQFGLVLPAPIPEPPPPLDAACSVPSTKEAEPVLQRTIATPELPEQLALLVPSRIPEPPAQSVDVSSVSMTVEADPEMQTKSTPQEMPGQMALIPSRSIAISDQVPPPPPPTPPPFADNLENQPTPQLKNTRKRATNDGGIKPPPLVQLANEQTPPTHVRRDARGANQPLLQDLKNRFLERKQPTPPSPKLNELPSAMGLDSDVTAQFSNIPPSKQEDDGPPPLFVLDSEIKGLIPPARRSIGSAARIFLPQQSTPNTNATQVKFKHFPVSDIREFETMKKQSPEIAAASSVGRPPQVASASTLLPSPLPVSPKPSSTFDQVPGSGVLPPQVIGAAVPSPSPVPPPQVIGAAVPSPSPVPIAMPPQLIVSPSPVPTPVSLPTPILMGPVPIPWPSLGAIPNQMTPEPRQAQPPNLINAPVPAPTPVSLPLQTMNASVPQPLPAPAAIQMQSIRSAAPTPTPIALPPQLTNAPPPAAFSVALPHQTISVPVPASWPAKATMPPEELAKEEIIASAPIPAPTQSISVPKLLPTSVAVPPPSINNLTLTPVPTPPVLPTLAAAPEPLGEEPPAAPPAPPVPEPSGEESEGEADQEEEIVVEDLAKEEIIASAPLPASLPAQSISVPGLLPSSVAVPPPVISSLTLTAVPTPPVPSTLVAALEPFGEEPVDEIHQEEESVEEESVEEEVIEEFEDEEVISIEEVPKLEVVKEEPSEDDTVEEGYVEDEAAAMPGTEEEMSRDKLARPKVAAENAPKEVALEEIEAATFEKEPKGEVVAAVSGIQGESDYDEELEETIHTVEVAVEDASIGEDGTFEGEETVVEEHTLGGEETIDETIGEEETIEEQTLIEEGEVTIVDDETTVDRTLADEEDPLRSQQAPPPSDVETAPNGISRNLDAIPSAPGAVPTAIEFSRMPASPVSSGLDEAPSNITRRRALAPNSATTHAAAVTGGVEAEMLGSARLQKSQATITPNGNAPKRPEASQVDPSSQLGPGPLNQAKRPSWVEQRYQRDQDNRVDSRPPRLISPPTSSAPTASTLDNSKGALPAKSSTGSEEQQQKKIVSNVSGAQRPNWANRKQLSQTTLEKTMEEPPTTKLVKTNSTTGPTPVPNKVAPPKTGPTSVSEAQPPAWLQRLKQQKSQRELGEKHASTPDTMVPNEVTSTAVNTVSVQEGAGPHPATRRLTWAEKRQQMQKPSDQSDNQVAVPAAKDLNPASPDTKIDAVGLPADVAKPTWAQRRQQLNSTQRQAEQDAPPLTTKVLPQSMPTSQVAAPEAKQPAWKQRRQSTQMAESQNGADSSLSTVEKSPSLTQTPVAEAKLPQAHRPSWAQQRQRLQTAKEPITEMAAAAKETTVEAKTGPDKKRSSWAQFMLQKASEPTQHADSVPSIAALPAVREVAQADAKVPSWTKKVQPQVQEHENQQQQTQTMSQPQQQPPKVQIPSWKQRQQALEEAKRQSTETVQAQEPLTLRKEGGATKRPSLKKQGSTAKRPSIQGPGVIPKRPSLKKRPSEKKRPSLKKQASGTTRTPSSEQPLKKENSLVKQHSVQKLPGVQRHLSESSGDYTEEEEFDEEEFEEEEYEEEEIVEEEYEEEEYEEVEEEEVVE